MNFFKHLLIVYSLSNQILLLVILMKIVYKKNNIFPRFQSKGIKQIVTEPTQIRGLLLDHIYIKYLWEFLNTFSTKTVANCYPDHE